MILSPITRFIFICLFLLSLLIMTVGNMYINYREQQFIEQTNKMVQATNKQIDSTLAKLHITPTPSFIPTHSPVIVRPTK